MTRQFELKELIRSDNFIDGQWRAAADGARFAVTDPATGTIIAQVADSSPADARASTNPASTSVSNAATSSALDGSRSSRMSRTSARVNPHPPTSPCAASYHCERQVFTESE